MNTALAFITVVGVLLGGVLIYTCLVVSLVSRIDPHSD